MIRDALLVTLLIAATFAGVAVLPPRVRLWVWLVVILGAVLPWSSFQNHTHWDRVAWVPFVAPPALVPRDVIGNVLLYVPLGLFCARRWPRARGASVLSGGLLSLATEASQLYSHGRFPSTTDVVLNVTGCAMGAWLGQTTRLLAPLEAEVTGRLDQGPAREGR